MWVNQLLVVMKKTINRVLIKYTDLTKSTKNIFLTCKDINHKGILWYHQFQLVVYNGMERNFHISPTFSDYTSVSDNI